MSATVTGYTILGVEVTEEEFWKKVGEEHRCTGYQHLVPLGQKFCGECGQEAKAVVVRESTEATRRLADLAGRGSDDLQEWERMVGHEKALLHEVAAMVPAKKSLLVLGVCLTDAGYSGDARGRVCEVSFPELEAARQRVFAMIKTIGLSDREVKLFPVVYYS